MGPEALCFQVVRLSVCMWIPGRRHSPASLPLTNFHNAAVAPSCMKVIQLLTAEWFSLVIIVFFVLLICSGWLQGTLLMVFYGLPDESYVLSRTAAYCNVDIWFCTCRLHCTMKPWQWTPYGVISYFLAHNCHMSVSGFWFWHRMNQSEILLLWDSFRFYTRQQFATQFTFHWCRLTC